MPRDQRDLFLQALVDHSRGLGRDNCRFCFVEPKYVHDGPDEQAVLSEYLTERYDATITHADPRELRVKDGEVFYEDTPVDVAYRDYELRELVELEKELGKPLDAMRLLFRENRVISSLVGDFDHKSVFEILTDEAIASKLFSADDRRLFRRHVLWTRIVGERRTTLPQRTLRRAARIRTHEPRAARAQAQPRLWRHGRADRFGHRPEGVGEAAQRSGGAGRRSRRAPGSCRRQRGFRCTNFPSSAPMAACSASRSMR